MLYLGYLASHVRQHEEVRIGHRLSQGIMAFIRHVNGMLLLVDDEIQLVSDLRHLPLVILQIKVFSFLKQLLHSRLAEEFNERLVFRKSLVSPQQQLSTLGLVPFCYLFLSIVQYLGHKNALFIVQRLNIWPEFHELLIVNGFRHRTRDNQRRTRIINEHGVDLIDNRVVMLPLNQVTAILSRR